LGVSIPGDEDADMNHARSAWAIGILKSGLQGRLQGIVDAPGTSR
jgi:hypothetical protein